MCVSGRVLTGQWISNRYVGAVMKFLCLSAAAIAFALGSCERHSWEDVKDEDGNVIWEVERRFVKEFHRGLPKYLHEYFQKLIGGMSEVPSENQVTVFTTNFLMFLQSHADLDDATYKEVVLGTQRFQENMKKKFLALKG